MSGYLVYCEECAEYAIRMGWPATGVASYYRNRRKDVLRFINSRHGDKVSRATDAIR